MELTVTIILYVSLGIQLFYLLFFFARLAFHSPKTAGAVAPLPVSIVVASHNEAPHLPRLLDGLLAQDYPEYEVIVVDDRSTDATPAILQRYGQQFSQLRHYRVEDCLPGIHPKKHAISVGIRHARYPWLALTDADCRPAGKYWLQSLQKSRKLGTEIVLGIGQYEGGKSLLGSWIRYETFYTAAQYLSFALAGLPYMGVGRNLSYSKDLFVRGGRFGKHQKITGGDDDLLVGRLAHRHNTAICIAPQGHTYSLPPRHWRSWFRQKTRHLSVGKYYKNRHKALLGLLNLSHICYYLSLGLIALLAENHSITWQAYVLRAVLFTAVFYQIGRKMAHKQALYLLPLQDFLYIFYYIATGIASVTTKSIKWK